MPAGWFVLGICSSCALPHQLIAWPGAFQEFEPQRCSNCGVPNLIVTESEPFYLAADEYDNFMVEE
jgi:hypothetical protein